MFRRLQRITIRNQLLLLTAAIIIVACIVFTAIGYVRQRHALLSGVDAKLYAAAQVAHLVPPQGYFDAIKDGTSVSYEEYENLVAKNNELCLELGLQYLWSCMVIDGQIVFATATSPSKDVTQHDHAGFLEVHSDPHAFDTVFRTMKPDYSSFRNEWGYGRMVLVPYTDRRGRPYCVGASIGINDVAMLLTHALWQSIGLAVAVLLGALIVVWFIANSFATPIARLTHVANAIAHGEMDQDIHGSGNAEIASLARSLTFMRDSIRRNISALKFEINQRKEAQERLSEHRDNLENEVRKRTADLQRSNRDLEQFAYVASHDLQEPLRKIAAFGNLLVTEQEATMTEEGRDYVGRMQGAARRMQTLISDLLTYSRVTTRGKPFEPVDLSRVLDEVVSDLEFRIKDTAGHVETGDLPVIEADRTQMRQLLQNLIVNGLKFHRENVPPVVRVRLVSDEPRDPPTPDPGAPPVRYACIAVEDNGIGFDARYRDRVFGIFQRLHPRTFYEGSGIGLAVCRKIVDRHNGTLTVESEPGKGSCFTFCLPIVQDDSSPGGTTQGTGEGGDD